MGWVGVGGGRVKAITRTAYAVKKGETDRHTENERKRDRVRDR